MRDSEIVNDYDFLKGLSVEYNNKEYNIDKTWKVKNTGEIYIALERNSTWLNIKASVVIKMIYEDITKTKCKRCRIRKV